MPHCRRHWGSPGKYYFSSLTIFMSFAKRCFISNLDTGNIIPNSRESLVRIIGTVHSIERKGCNQEDHKAFPGLQHYDEDFNVLILDDGTALAKLWTPCSMTNKLSLRGGETIECIARLYQNGSTQRRWYSEALILVTDPNIEYMRWMELGNPPQDENECRNYGYPTIRKNSKEAYRLICLQYRLSANGKKGVKTKDLAVVMRLPLSEVENMIQELQLNGQVYQNENGNFVPL